jgi:hypothetical protein
LIRAGFGVIRVSACGIVRIAWVRPSVQTGVRDATPKIGESRLKVVIPGASAFKRALIADVPKAEQAELVLPQIHV